MAVKSLHPNQYMYIFERVLLTYVDICITTSPHAHKKLKLIKKCSVWKHISIIIAPLIEQRTWKVGYFLMADGLLLKVSSTSLSVACQQMATLSDLKHGSTLFAY